MTKNKKRFLVKKTDSDWEPFVVVDTLTGVGHVGCTLESFAQKIADRMELTAKPPVVLHPRIREDFLKLSFYTLCKVTDHTRIGSVEGLVLAVERGEFQGILTVDDLGNFISFV